MRKVLAIFCAIALLVALLAACGQAETESADTSAETENADTSAETESADTSAETESADTSAETDDVTEASVAVGDKIGISLTTQSSERWVRDGNTLSAALEDADYEVEIQYCENNPQTQIQQIENMMTVGCSVIIVAPTDNGALSAVLAEAKNQGVVIINYDLGLVGTDDVDYFVGFNNQEVGTMQAQTIIEGLGLDEGAEGPFYVELFAGSLAEANCYYYFDGGLAALQPYIDEGKIIIKSGQTDIETCTVTDWKLDLLQTRLDTLMTTHYSDGTLVDAMLVPVDYFVSPIVTQLQSLGYGEADMPMPIITGNDATESVCKLIAQDLATMSVFKDTSLLAEACVDIVEALANGEEPPVNATYMPDEELGYEIPTIFVPMYSLNKDNLDELVIDTGFYEKDAIYGE